MRGLLGLLAIPAPPPRSIPPPISNPISTPASFASVRATSASTSASVLPTPSRISRRAAIPACLKTVELSCLNLAANCIDTVDAETFNNLWGIKSCVAAATCYGVGDLISSVECQTGFVRYLFLFVIQLEQSADHNQRSTGVSGLCIGQAIDCFLPLSTNVCSQIYAGIVGDCAWNAGGCPITQQNYIDFYYGELSAINSANYPSSNSVVISFWNAITTWAATGNSVPYLNFNDWLHFSSFPSTTTTTDPPSPTYTQIEWSADPNPIPSSGAVSETFANSETNVIIAIPSTTTVIIFASARITLAPGGTPVNGPLPSDVSMPGAITPTWNPNIVPPVSVPSVTFTVPPSFTTVVAVPTSSDSPPQNITGPPGDKNSNGDDWWLLLFGGLIGGLLPKDVGIPGGVTPSAAPPAGWTGSWTDPSPTSTSTSTSTSSKTASASSSSAAPTCLTPSSGYHLSDDSENEDWDGQGTDPDRRRSALIARAGRTMKFSSCGLSVTNPQSVDLKAAYYYSIGLNNVFGSGIVLSGTKVGGRPNGNGAGDVNQIGHVGQFLLWLIRKYPQLNCNWFANNVWDPTGWDGVTSWAQLLLGDIDDVRNMVWVDKPMNQAKSNIVNNNRAAVNNPPQKDNIDKIMDLVSTDPLQDVEYFLRNLAALGTYFRDTAGVFQYTALRVQHRLSQITPQSPDVNLPVEFNSWLRQLLATYPTGCTSRGDNSLAYYRRRVQLVATQTNTAIPPCLSVYHMGVTPQNFNWQDLAPPAFTFPSCNFPGTEGEVQSGVFQDGTPVLSSGFRILGANDTQHYGLGTGSNFVANHFIAADISTQFPGCEWSIGTGTLPVGQPKFENAFISMQCNGNTGGVTVPFSFVVKDQPLHCSIIYSPAQPNMGALLYYICAVAAATASACANNQILPGLTFGSYILTGATGFIPT
ncbi:chitin synthase [Favolaschia claudopus]|uniref:Chitin synthase n=1 Tax=Favolaschia claudopus TaxID=2862362 RepID=A0AAW0E446_9AGAR